MSGRTLDSWAQIKLDDGLDENEARAQVHSQVQSLIRDIPFPWRTVELTPQLVEIMVMDILQQELDDASHPDRYRRARMKCLQALCKARNTVPSSLCLRDVIREGENPVGGGGFADIWKGRLRDAQVCLKVLRVFCPEEQQAKVLRDFCQEALVWRQLRHPNVLPFLGVNEDIFAPRYCLISPWMVNGNIMSYIEAHPDHDRLTSLVQIAEGMKYLHGLNPPIVHADIRGANILVMDDLCCCLADFGLSLFAESQTLDSSSRMSKGSARWLAPEYIDPDAVIDRAYVTARDVYAYGCTVVEMFTGKPPFSEIKNEAAVIHAVMKGSRQLRPQHLLQDRLWSLVTRCLITSPSQRPTAGQISKDLAGQIKPCQEVIEEGNITAHHDNDGVLQGTSGNDGRVGSASATTVVQHRGPTPTDVLSGSDPQTQPSPPADVRNSIPTSLHTPPSRVSSIHRPISSRTADFNDFTSRRRPAIRDTSHVADSTERVSAWTTSATARSFPLPRRSRMHDPPSDLQGPAWGWAREGHWAQAWLSKSQSPSPLGFCD